MTDLILSVVKNRSWKDLDCYANSLATSGYRGRRVMLLDDGMEQGVEEEAIIRLNSMGFETPKVSSPRHWHFQTARFLPALAYLRQHEGEFDRVLWTDACDVVFQADPSPAMRSALGTFQLAAVKEGWAIKNQGINDVWIKRLRLSEAEYLRLREEEVLCSGTIAGTPEAMALLFDAMASRFASMDDMQGMDQGLFNHVVRTKPFCDITRIPEPEEGFVTTLGIFLAPSDPATWTIAPPVLDRATGTALTPDRYRPYAIVHQYNRNYGQLDPNGDWRFITEARYRA